MQGPRPAGAGRGGLPHGTYSASSSSWASSFTEEGLADKAAAAEEEEAGMVRGSVVLRGPGPSQKFRDTVADSQILARARGAAWSLVDGRSCAWSW